MNKRDELRAVTQQLVDLLRAEGVLHRYEGLLRLLEWLDDDESPETNQVIRSLVRSMLGGSGTLLDYLCYREDRQEGIRLNDLLDSLRYRMYDLSEEL